MTDLSEPGSELARPRLLHHACQPVDADLSAVSEKPDDGERKGLPREGNKKPHVLHNSNNDSWYTPAEIIDRVRAVLGTIDCDPASCEEANRVVQATRYYTAEDSGLDMSKPWARRVYMNPPYSRKLIGPFCQAMKARYLAGEVIEAIVLVNNSSETLWSRALSSVASALCQPSYRISFYGPGGVKGGRKPLQAQAVFYLGPNVETFRRVFSALGPVWIMPVAEAA